MQDNLLCRPAEGTSTATVSILACYLSAIEMERQCMFHMSMHVRKCMWPLTGARLLGTNQSGSNECRRP